MTDCGGARRNDEAERQRTGGRRVPPLRDRLATRCSWRVCWPVSPSGTAMPAIVHHVTHPLIQHKLTLMRQKDRSTNSFRRLLNEISMLMAYEVTRDMPTSLIEIET